jgi:Protein of unknown function (DUF2905)
MLIALGLVVAAVGVLILLTEKLPIRLGHLPGDISIRGKNSVFLLSAGDVSADQRDSIVDPVDYE